jgi:hypothetical protein
VVSQTDSYHFASCGRFNLDRTASVTSLKVPRKHLDGVIVLLEPTWCPSSHWLKIMSLTSFAFVEMTDF